MNGLKVFEILAEQACKTKSDQLLNAVTLVMGKYRTELLPVVKDEQHARSPGIYNLLVYFSQNSGAVIGQTVENTSCYCELMLVCLNQLTQGLTTDEFKVFYGREFGWYLELLLSGAQQFQAPQALVVFKFICNWASYCIEHKTAQKFYDINQVL